MANPLAPVVLTAATVHTFTLDYDWHQIEVLNDSDTDGVWCTIDGTDPVVRGAGSQYVRKASAISLPSPVSNGPTFVKVISDGTPEVYVRGIPQ
jgi:hypothetical protein